MSNRRKTRLRGKDWEPLSRQIRTMTQEREDQLRAEINAVSPCFIDQLTAATVDGARTFAGFRRAMKDSDPGRYREADPSRLAPQFTDRVHGLFLRVVAETATGERARCPHISLDKPRPAVACVHDAWICCRECFTRGLHCPPPVLTEREEHTCDLCGR